MKASAEIADGLVDEPHDARDILSCSGVAIAFPGGDWKRVGETPTYDHLVGLAAKLDQRPGDWQVFHSDELVQEYSPAAEFKDCASGLLALRIPKGNGNYTFWFKPEVLRTITWAGDPNKPLASESSVARLGPRASFESWIEIVRMKSVPWARWEIELVETLGHAIVGTTFIQKLLPPESAAKLQTVLQRSLQSMGHLIDDLLSIAKPRSMIFASATASS